MINTLIFDLGGVLTIGKHTDSIEKLIENNNNLSKGSVAFMVNEFMKPLNRNKINFEQFTNGINEKLKINISIGEMEQIFEESIILNYELIDYIKKLKEKYKLILFSNNNVPTIKILNDKYKDLLDLFDKSYFSVEFNTGKPSLDFFEHMMKDSGLKPDECLFIDDKEKNILAGNEVGIKGIVFLSNSQLKEELASFSFYYNE